MQAVLAQLPWYHQFALLTKLRPREERFRYLPRINSFFDAHQVDFVRALFFRPKLPLSGVS